MLKRLLVILIALLIGAGCQSGENPLAPIDLNDSPAPDITRVSDSNTGPRALWGLFEWVIDLENETFDAVPLRSSGY